MTASEQLHLKEYLVLSAVWQSFHFNETILSLHQLLLRRLTPTEAMSRHYIMLLLRLGLVTASDLPDKPGMFLSIRGGKTYFTAVRVSAEPPFLLDRRTLTRNRRTAHSSLLEIILELLAANVVEYVKYFADKEKLNIEGLDYKSSSLRIFFENISLSQTFMLFWRAIKNCAETQRSIHFNQIIDLAYQYFENYCSSGKEITPYPRPRSMGQSRLEKVIFCDILMIKSDPDLMPNVHEYLTESLECHCIFERDLDLAYFDTPFEDR